MGRRDYHGPPKHVGTAVLLVGASLLRLAWLLCPLPDLLRRGDDAITTADLGTVD